MSVAVTVQLKKLMPFVEELHVRPEHGYVVLTLGACFLFHIVLLIYVGLTRMNKYKVPYPIMYLPEKDKQAKSYNSMQRAHQNILENMPMHLMLVGVGGVYRPLVASAAGMLRLFGFFIYFRGYCIDPELRKQGFFGYIGQWILFGLVAELGIKMLWY